jgi:hypothetical protein
MKQEVTFPKNLLRHNTWDVLVDGERIGQLRVERIPGWTRQGAVRGAVSQRWYYIGDGEKPLALAVGEDLRARNYFYYFTDAKNAVRSAAAKVTAAGVPH